MEPRTLNQQKAREWLGVSDGKFREWKQAVLICPLEGNLYLVSELSALVDELVKRRDVKRLRNGNVPRKEAALGIKKTLRRRVGGQMSEVLLGCDRRAS